MKNKITISLDENILSRIDASVEAGNWKNRSAVIEDILKERYGEFVDVTAIFFSHDRKWDNREYPFDVPKPLLEIRKRTIVDRQVEAFYKAWVRNMIFLIETNSKSLFEEELTQKYPNVNFDFVEIDTEIKTWDALKVALWREHTSKNLMIANWDIFYWNLNVEEYYNYHKEQKSDFSMLLKFVFNPEQLWNVQIYWNKIINFVDRPKAKQTYLTNSGLYITTREFLDKHNFWAYLEHDFFPNLPNIANTIWYVYPWEWEHIQNDSAYERANWWLM